MKDYWRGGACEHSAIIPFISRGIGVEAIFQSNSNLRGNFLRKPHYRRQAVRELSRHERLPLWGYHGQGPGASKGQRGGRSPRREVCTCMPGLLPNTFPGVDFRSSSERIVEHSGDGVEHSSSIESKSSVSRAHERSGRGGATRDASTHAQVPQRAGQARRAVRRGKRRVASGTGTGQGSEGNLKGKGAARQAAAASPPAARKRVATVARVTTKSQGSDRRRGQ